MTDLPEYVYLIKPNNEWPISCVEREGSVESVVQQRRGSRNVGQDGIVRVWRVPTTEAVEMELVPSRVVPSSVKPKQPPSPDESGPEGGWR